MLLVNILIAELGTEPVRDHRQKEADHHQKGHDDGFHAHDVAPFPWRHSPTCTVRYPVSVTVLSSVGSVFRGGFRGLVVEHQTE